MLKSLIGVALYRLLPNHLSWPLLSDAERDIVRQANARHNVERQDYADPTKYMAGRSFDSDEDRAADRLGITLSNFLDQHAPQSVLEIGPGSGFLTRAIVEHPAVERYVGIDINRAFLSYLEPRLARVAQSKPFEYQLICSDALRPQQFEMDAVILMSTVHHIPDRVELFRTLNDVLGPGGAILTHDPSHYAPRIWRLIRKTLTNPGYFKKQCEDGGTLLATHSFCTLAEYKKVVRSVSALTIDRRVFAGHPWPFSIGFAIARHLPSRLSTWIVERSLLSRVLSSEMSVTFLKRPATGFGRSRQPDIGHGG